MMLLTLLAACALGGWGIVIIEKKRRAGALTYPLWRGNLLLVWAVSAALATLFMSGMILPKYIGLVLHGVPVQASITANTSQGRCSLGYSYRVKDRSYEGSDSMCGLKAGDMHGAFYDRDAPENSTLYPPPQALTNEAAAMLIIAVCLSAFLVLWLRMTYVIGKKL